MGNALCNSHVLRMKIRSEFGSFCCHVVKQFEGDNTAINCTSCLDLGCISARYS
jgi:hypothetical protein